MTTKQPAAFQTSLSPVFDRRFVFVTGKGGVGKSLISAALAVRAAQRGERTLWVEMTESPRGGALFPGFEPRYALATISPGLWGMNLRLQPAIEEYLAVAFKLPLITRMIARNSLFQVLTGALPGLDSLIPLGKIWYELGRKRGRRPYWDRIVLDAPATGHALAMLRFPAAALDITRSGNVAERSREIDQILRDKNLSALLVVTTLEELPVDETRDLVERVHAETPYRIDALICNAVAPDIGAGDSERYARWLKGGSDGVLDRAAGASPDRQRLRLAALAAQRAGQMARLDLLAPLKVPLYQAPWMPAAGPDEVLDELIEAMDP